MDNEKSASKTSTKEAHIATAFLSGLNQVRYGVLLNDLHNTFWMELDDYPNTFNAVYDMAINWKGDTKGPSVAPNFGIYFTTE